MCVVDRMTRDAVRRRLLVSIANMAPQAIRFLVSANQRICRRIMVEACRCPADLVMAVTALLSEGSAMCIVVSMTIDAVQWRVTSRNIGQMTGRAGNALMRP